MSSHLDYEINKELGECYLFMGELEKAANYYEKAAASNTLFAAPHLGLATIAMQNGKSQDALVHYQKAFELEESDKAIAGLGLAYLDLGRHDEAFNAFCRALTLNPGNSIALNCLVRESFETNRLEEAVPTIEASLAQTQDENTRVSLAGCLYALNRESEACNHLEMVLAQNPENANAQDLLTFMRQPAA